MTSDARPGQTQPPCWSRWASVDRHARHAASATAAADASNVARSMSFSNRTLLMPAAVGARCNASSGVPLIRNQDALRLVRRPMRRALRRALFRTVCSVVAKPAPQWLSSSASMTTEKAANVAQPPSAPCQPAAQEMQDRRGRERRAPRSDTKQARGCAPLRASTPPVKQPAAALFTLSCLARIYVAITRGCSASAQHGRRRRQSTSVCA